MKQPDPQPEQPGLDTQAILFSLQLRVMTRAELANLLDIIDGAPNFDWAMLQELSKKATAAALDLTIPFLEPPESINERLLPLSRYAKLKSALEEFQEEFASRRRHIAQAIHYANTTAEPPPHPQANQPPELADRLAQMNYLRWTIKPAPTLEEFLSHPTRRRYAATARIVWQQAAFQAHHINQQAAAGQPAKQKLF